MVPLRALFPQGSALRHVLRPHTTRHALTFQTSRPSIDPQTTRDAAVKATRNYGTGPGPVPKWNPYPARSPGLAAKMWFRPDGTPRSKLKGVLFVTISTFILLMFNSGIDLIRDYERAAFLLAYLLLVQKVDATYHQHDFDSLDGTKEYFYKLCRALPQDDEDDDEGSIEQFIDLVEETIEKARIARQESSIPLPESPTPPAGLSPFPSAQALSTYLSYVALGTPAPGLPSPGPDPLQAIHLIMRACAEANHEMIEKDLAKETVVACAHSALLGFALTVGAIGKIAEKVGVVEEGGAVGKEVLANVKGWEGGKGDGKDGYESIG